ncbi:Protein STRICTOSIDINE SYNTHASE-LIKE 10 [Linum perenne]
MQQSDASLWLPKVFAQLERFPDNIKRNAKGDGFWVALNSKRGRIRRSTEGEGEYDDLVGVKLSEDGEVVKVNIRDITSAGSLPKLGIEMEEAGAPSAADGEDKQGTSLCSYH